MLVDIIFDIITGILKAVADEIFHIEPLVAPSISELLPRFISMHPDQGIHEQKTDPCS